MHVREYSEERLPIQMVRKYTVGVVLTLKLCSLCSFVDRRGTSKEAKASENARFRVNAPPQVNRNANCTSKKVKTVDKYVYPPLYPTVHLPRAVRVLVILRNIICKFISTTQLLLMLSAETMLHYVYTCLYHRAVG